jgi:hypothetical protein
MRKGDKKTMARLAAAAFAAALSALVLPAPAPAQNLIESFFNSLGRALSHGPLGAPPPSRAFSEPFERFERAITPPSAPIRTGPSTAFCVRTCDGHYFPVRAHAGLSAAQACRTFCPASPTRLYFGGSIDSAVARDGSGYTELANAYAYRKKLVAGCTCNGHDRFGLAHIDPRTDPTLRPGDIVATRDGLLAFTGRKGKTANFTPVDSYRHFSRRYRDQLSELRIRSAHR